MHHLIRQDLLELAAAYAEYSVIITTAELDEPGPQFLYVNSAFTRMTGYSILDTLGKNPRILQGPNTDRATLRRLRESLSAGHDFIARTTNYKRDNTPFELEWIISHLRDSSNRTTHYIALQRDITGQKRAQEDLASFDTELRNASSQFAEALSQLEHAEKKVAEREKMAMIGELAQGIVHDISNAITPIYAMVQFLITLDNLPKVAHENMVSMMASTQHAVDLLTNLKLYYRNSHSASVRTGTDLQHLLKSIPELTKSKWWSPMDQALGQIHFVLDLQKTPLVLCNETQLTQVFINLVNNAVEAMPNGGELTIQLGSNSGNVVARVSDTGVGMSDDQLKHCFVKDFTSRPQGSGLGLSVCRRIVEDHCGQIEVDRNTPRGITFTVYLPTIELLEEQGNRQSSGSPARILLIDNDHSREEILSSKLRRRGHHVEVAVGGDEGLTKFFQGDYDVVIASSEMQPTSGHEVVQVIRRSRPEVSVVISVGSSEDIRSNNLPLHLHPDAIISADCSEAELSSVLRKLGS